MPLFSIPCLEADVVRQLTQATKQPFIAVMPVMMIAAIAHIPIDAILDAIDQPVEHHLPTEHGSRASERAHGIFAAIALHEASQSTCLLSLVSHISRCGHDARQAGVTADTRGRIQRSDRHTDRATQHHRLLTHHRLRLIATLSILLRVLLLWIGRLSVLLLILWVLLLRILLWVLRLRILGILPRRRVVLLGTELVAAAGAEVYARSVLRPTVCTKGWRCTGGVHIMAAIGTKRCARGHLRIAGRAEMDRWCHRRCHSALRL